MRVLLAVIFRVLAWLVAVLKKLHAAPKRFLVLAEGKLRRDLQRALRQKPPRPSRPKRL
jgi:hypothetical protein